MKNLFTVHSFGAKVIIIAVFFVKKENNSKMNVAVKV